MIPKHPSANDVLTSPDTLTSSADDEPIHTPGAIQPHGLMLVLSMDEWRVLQTSANTKKLLGLPRNRVLGRDVSDLFGAEAFTTLEPLLTRPVVKSSITRSYECSLKWGTRRFHAHTYPSGGRMVLELEPAQTAEEISQLNLHKALHECFMTLSVSPDLLTLCAEVAFQVRIATGFDRVMIYRFDAEWNGEVVAEARSDDHRLVSYLGLHFPAADIPLKARELFMLTGVRVIPDVHARPVRLMPCLDPETTAPLDMECAKLRAVSPIHIKYLQNMGVGGSLTIAIVRQGVLWGLVACHHATPRHIPVSLRNACKLIGQLFSVALTAREEAEEACYRLELKASLTSFLAKIAQEESLSDSLLCHQPNLLNCIASDGFALKLDSKMILQGETPSLKETEALFCRLAKRASEGVWATDALAHALDDTEDLPAGIGGVLALLLPGDQPRGVLWMRQEVLRSVHWGGDPNQTVQVDAANGELHPRNSFALWKEQVRGCSLAWRSCEIAAAAELRTVLIGLLLLSSERKANNAHRALQWSEESFRTLLELSPTLVFIKDAQGRLLFASHLFTRRFGISPEQWQSKTDDELWPADVAVQIRTSDLAALEVNEPVEMIESLPLPDGTLSLWLTVKFPIPDISGSKLLASQGIDITESRATEVQLRTSLHEKEVLLREIHHRVKNNLQVVASMLKLQERQTPDRVSADALSQSQDRVRSMALIHEHLYLSDSLARIDLMGYLENLSDSLMSTHSQLADQVQLTRMLTSVQADLDMAVPLGLIVNELLTNALKHAFADGRQGRIDLALTPAENGCYQLVISDNGVGMPADLDMTTTHSLGLRLVRSLTRQIHGKLVMSQDNGTRFTVLFSLNPSYDSLE
ncbi:MAG: GAF domain-containing protein [Anaerolineae bacterium]|nr:GAF domain-containing protein [Gloeobacterales cyanobacterium ES-bin-313]